MTTDPLDSLMMQAIMNAFNPPHGYGGVAMCIKCKKAGIDRYTSASGQEVNLCETCPNNMQAVKNDAEH